MSEATRIAALKAAVELRTGASTPADIKAAAQEFDDWLTRRISAPLNALSGSETKACAPHSGAARPAR